MFNVLKNALIYTGMYFIISTVVFWGMFFILVAVQVFWKPMAAIFLILFAIFTFDHFKKRVGPVSAREVKLTVQDVIDSVKAKYNMA